MPALRSIGNCLLCLESVQDKLMFTARYCLTDCPPPQVDIIFVIDSSTSVGARNFIKIINFVRSMIENADISQDAVRVGLLTFSSTATIRFNLNEVNSRGEFLQRLERIPYAYGDTNTAEALRVLRQQMFTESAGDRQSTRNMAVIITDGESNINSYDVEPESRRLHEAGVRVLGIGINLKDSRELNIIASTPKETNRFDVDDFNKLSKLKTDLFPTRCKGILGALHTGRRDNKALCIYL